MKALPKFQTRNHNDVYTFISLGLSRQADTNIYLRELVNYEDGHYRAIFDRAYFGKHEPSKSQWNTLKKRLKRMDNLVFIFKEHGSTEDNKHYYLDFGFFND